MTTVVAAVIERAGRVLICQRRSDGAHPLKWEFPGGKVDAGETPEAALVRELEEELSIHALLNREIARYSYQYPGKDPILLVFYRVLEFHGEPVNRVFERMEWAQPEALANYDFLEGDRDFLRSLTAG